MYIWYILRSERLSRKVIEIVKLRALDSRVQDCCFRRLRGLDDRFINVIVAMLIPHF